MSELRTCPSRDDLQRMVLGQLPDATARSIQEHLERCLKCMRALEECIASDELLEAVRASRGGSCEPTKTIYLPVEWIRGAVLTWIRAHDSTQSAKRALPASMADIQRLLDPPRAAGEIGRIADFRVLRLLGIGGMAVVFEAEDCRLKRRVALKLMHPAVATQPGGADRFLREAQSAAALKHDHVVTIYQVGTHGQTPFMALELLHGQTLEDDLVHNGRLSIDEIIRIGREIATGLAAAHSRGLLHRDIKPANIWLEGSETSVPAELFPRQADTKPPTTAVESHPSAKGRHTAGRAKILDFGCAKAWVDESGITYPGLLIGTPAYMAPEQLTGKPVDPRADLFSLGCVLYRMASGKQAFGGGDLLSVVRALALEDPTPLTTVNPQVPQALSELVSQLLSKSPDDRPTSAGAVVERLQVIERSLQAERAAASRRTLDSAANRGRRWTWAMGAGIALALLVSLAGYYFGAQVIRVVTNKGQIVIETDDPGIGVTVSENRVVIHDGNGPSEITLTAGEHQLDVTVKQPSGEVSFPTDRFTLRRGGKKIIDVREELNQAVAARARGSANLADDQSRLERPSAQRGGPAPDRVSSDRKAASWVLSAGGVVTVRVSTQENPITIEHGQPLPVSDFELRKLSLKRCAVADADLNHLQGLTRLVELDLSRTRVTDAGLSALEGLRQLDVLDLCGTQVTDAGLARLHALPNLRVLNVSLLPVTDTGLATICSLPKLQFVLLIKTKVTDAGISQLQGLPGLCSLWLGETVVTEAGLAELEKVKELRYLNLRGALRVGDAAIDQLLRLRKLSTIDVLNTGVTTQGLARLKAGFPNSLQIIWADPNVLAAKAVLSAGGWVDVQLEKGGTVTPVRSSAELPSEPFRLTGTMLSGTRTALEDVFVELTRPGINSLVSVDLSRATIGDADLVCLQRLPKGLRRLVLAGSGIHGPGLKVLSRFTHLGDLMLNNTGTTDADLAHVQGLTELWTLELDRTPLTDAGLARIGQLKNLHSLSLRQTAVSDAGLKHLEGLDKLTSLILDQTRLMDAGLAHLRPLSALTNLGLAHTAVTNAGLTQIQHLPNLDTLWLIATGVSDPGVAMLKECKMLHFVSLNWTKVTDAGLVHLAGMTQLDSLDLRGLSLTDAGLAHLRGLTNLRYLNLSRVPVTDAGLVHLVGLNNLEHLDLEETRVADAGLRSLSKMSRLDTLVLNQTRVTDAELSELRSLKRLSYLGLRDLSGVGDAAVPKIVGLSSLLEVNLRNTHVSAKGAAVLKSVRPKLQVAWSEPNDSLAKAVLAAGGSVDVHLEGPDRPRSVRAIGELPAESFAVTAVRLAGPRRTLEELLPTLINPRLTSLVSIDLSGGPLRDSDLDRLKPLVALKELKLARTQITDAGLARLTGMMALRSLVLDGDDISGQGLLAIQRLPELTELRLGCPVLADLFLGELATLPKLERLSLAGSNLSDDGARYLSHLTRLKELDLRHTNVTAVRVAELQKRLPNCHIITSMASSPEFDSK